MFQWLFNWAWDRGAAQRAPGAEYESITALKKLSQGKRYKAVLTLDFFSAMASNATVAGKLAEVGFKDVKVTGADSKRLVEGTWSKSDLPLAEIDSRFSEIEVVA